MNVREKKEVLPVWVMPRQWRIFIGAAWLFLGIPLYVMYGWSGVFAAGMLLTMFLLWIAVTDGCCGMIFDRVLLPMAILGILVQVSLLPAHLGDLLLGVLAGSGILLGLRCLSHGGMGGGDIKMAAALGCWLGWQGVMLTLFMAFLLGGLWAVWLLVIRRRHLQDSMAFGPFLAAGAYIDLLWGPKLLAFYGTWFL